MVPVVIEQCRFSLKEKVLQKEKTPGQQAITTLLQLQTQHKWVKILATPL